MASCPHAQWLRLYQDQSNFTLHSSNRLQNIAQSLPHPSSQYPSLLFFSGKGSKLAALRNIYPGCRLANHRHHGLANICIDPKTINDDYPVVLVDGCPEGAAQVVPSAAEHKCHEITSQSLHWSENKNSPPQRQNVIDSINARLLSLFIDVLCIFAEDCGGLAGVVEKLTSWASIGSASSLPSSVRPRVVIVTHIQVDTFDSEVLRFRSRLFSTPKFSQVFSSLNVVNIPGKLRPSTKVQYGALKEVLAQETQTSRLARTDSFALFSFTHSASFFEKALGRFCKWPKATFDFIRASRDDNTVSEQFDEHISMLTSICLEYKLPSNFLLPFIATAIMMDSSPPDMHLFDPSHVFHRLYRPLLLRGLKNFTQSQQLSSELICADIEAEIIDLCSDMNKSCQSASVVRSECLSRLKTYFGPLKTFQTCLYCLMRKPEHVLGCGHAICDACIVIFGERARELEYHFNLDMCLLCEVKVDFQARLLPPTCGVRFISIDGGGSRGIVPLEYLDALQEALGLDYPVQEHFDYGIGTSTGSIVVLALFTKYWSTKKCLKFFPKFAKTIFPSRVGIKSSIFAKARTFLVSYFTDGRYDATSLEAVLKKTLGSRPLFDSVGSRPSGMKIAVTATTISDATLCLLSNYNGGGSYSKDFRCKHLRASRAADEVLVWEAARCTTAAPWYFKPKFLKAFGTFQDGGLKYNNPVRPGLREVQRVWRDRECDLVLSIGTGFEEQLSSPKAPNVRNLFQDGAIARLYRASMSSLSLDSGNNWKDHWFGLEEETKGQHFRLDLPLEGKQPDIDDVDQMPELQQQVRHHLGDLKSLERAVKAVSFFFELDRPLIREGTGYRCHGLILSRSPRSRALLQNLAIEYPYAQFLTNNEASLGFLDPSNSCEGCGRFYKVVTFSVRHPSEVVNIYLAYNRLFRRSISSFPHSMEWFEGRQKLNNQFGRADHKPRVAQPLEADCSCTRHRYTDATTGLRTGKRRLISEGTRRSKRHCA